MLVFVETPVTNRDVRQYFTSPQDLGDGIAVGTLDLPGTEAAIAALLADDETGKFQKLDSILLWKHGV